jgi:regulator of sigma E protease
MFEWVLNILGYAIPFVVVLSVLVFVHELGHYLVARWCGVKVETFSIGFGREIIGFTDKSGTRWKFSLIPLGGYVQMFGDTDPASTDVDLDQLQNLNEDERRRAFFYKPVWQRAGIVFAGPAINFIYAIVVLTGLFAIQGQPYTPAIVGGLVKDGAAIQSGFQLNDKIVSINGIKIERFQELQRLVTVNLGQDMVFGVERESGSVTITTAPKVMDQKDRFGFRHQVGLLGIESLPKTEIKEHHILSAAQAATKDTWSMTTATLKAIGQMISGVRSTEELGGIIRIGAYAKEFAKDGIMALIMFSAIISVNLGLINLFPIPLLDGGHLMFYAWEAVARKPMPEKMREIGIRIGYGFVILLMVYATFNDLSQLRFFAYLKNLVS